MKRNLLLLAALSCFANPMDHLPMTSPEFSSITNSRSVEEKEQWGPENGWSWMELGFFDFDPMTITSFEFRDYHFHSKWRHLLEGVTVQVGNKKCKVENGDVELTLDYREPIDTLMIYNSHKYVSAGTYNATSNKLFLDFEDDRLISVVSGIDTIYSLVYDDEGILHSAKDQGNEISITYIKDTVIVDKTSSAPYYFIYDSHGREKSHYVKDSTFYAETTYEQVSNGTKETIFSYSLNSADSNHYLGYEEVTLVNSYGVDFDWYGIAYDENGDTSYEYKSSVELFNDNTISKLKGYSKDSLGQWGLSDLFEINKNEQNSVEEVIHDYFSNYTSPSKTKYTYYPNGWPSTIEYLSLQEDGTWKQTSLDSIHYSGEPLGTIPVTKAEKSEVTVMQNGTDLLMTLPSELKSEPISLYTMNGRKIDEVTPIDGIAQISTKSLSSGVYFYRVRGAEGKFLIK